jgi:methyl-accepting chemotaxis protein
VNSESASIDKDLQKCGEAITSDESSDLRIIKNDIDSQWASYKADIDTYAKLLGAGDTTKASNLAFGTMALKGVELRDKFLNLFNSLSAEAGARSSQNSGQALAAVIIMCVVIAAALLLAVVLALVISGMIGKPITKMEKVAALLAVGNMEVDSVLTAQDMKLSQQRDEIGGQVKAFSALVDTTKQQVAAIQKLAAGDLTTEFSLRSDKDLLSKGLSEMTDNINQLISSIIAASEQVLSGANLVSDSSIILSQGATEQAGSVQELTAAIDEIATQTSTNAQNANQADSLARLTKENASKGNTQMQDMLNAMEEISRASSDIKKIIKVIDDIAFQTNILALNAAVEAARAGQHGKALRLLPRKCGTLASRSATLPKRRRK